MNLDIISETFKLELNAKVIHAQELVKELNFKNEIFKKLDASKCEVTWLQSSTMDVCNVYLTITVIIRTV